MLKGDPGVLANSKNTVIPGSIWIFMYTRFSHINTRFSMTSAAPLLQQPALIQQFLVWGEHEKHIFQAKLITCSHNAEKQHDFNISVEKQLIKFSNLQKRLGEYEPPFVRPFMRYYNFRSLIWYEFDTPVVRGTCGIFTECMEFIMETPLHEKIVQRTSRMKGAHAVIMSTPGFKTLHVPCPNSDSLEKRLVAG